MTILLLGRDGDLHLDSVLHELRGRRVAAIRVDPERLTPSNTSLSGRWSDAAVSAVIDTYAGRIVTSEIHGVLCRYSLDSPPVLRRDPLENFRISEFWSAAIGMLLQIPGIRWINDPFLEARADHKGLQLALAQEVGLRVPASLVSQDIREIVDFSERLGPCVVKTISDVGLTRINGLYSNELPHNADGEVLCSFAHRLNPSVLKQEGVDFSCPVFLQAEVPKQSDLRVTIVDDCVFSVEQVQTAGGGLDIRNAEATEVRPFSLRPDVGKALVALVKKLGLRYASCDLAYVDGTAFFLEANVSGNWLWTEQLAGLPISSAVADALLRHAPA